MKNKKLKKYIPELISQGGLSLDDKTAQIIEDNLPNSECKIVNSELNKEQAKVILYDEFRPEYDNRKVKLYALTLTISPAEYKALIKQKYKELEIFQAKLKVLGIGGSFVREYTKKGVPHLHGIIKFPVVEDIIQEDISQYIRNKWGYMICLKNIPDITDLSGWIEYMTKDMFSKYYFETLRFLEKKKYE